MDIVRESRKIHKERKQQELEKEIKQSKDDDNNEEDNFTITIDVKISKKGFLRKNKKVFSKIIDLTNDAILEII